MTRTGAEPGHGLGPEWRTGPDGVPFRRGARVLVLDDRDRVLLLRGHDADAPGRRWWFTVGGGIAQGETAVGAAVRETFEETGLLLDPTDLVGPVFTRSAVFDFLARTCRQDEVFFLARVRGPVGLSTSRWTDVERRILDELRWWSPEALARVPEEVFPADLPRLVSGLRHGWDGRTRHLPPDPPRAQEGRPATLDSSA